MYDPYVLEPGMPLIALADRAAKSIGLMPVLEATGGGSDANFFNTYGVPSAVLGVGMSKVHTAEENVKVEDLNKAAAFVVAIIKQVADMN
jgi:tripeptide aminopeptidase